LKPGADGTNVFENYTRRRRGFPEAFEVSWEDLSGWEETDAVLEKSTAAARMMASSGMMPSVYIPWNASKLMLTNLIRARRFSSPSIEVLKVSI